MPYLFVIAGPNGSGKTTLVKKLSPRFRKKITFINPDEIAKRLKGSYLQKEDNSLMIKAAKEAIRQREKNLLYNKNFGFETTLSGNSEIRFISKAKERGYKVILVFIGLENPELNILRVKQRVEDKGHFVAPKIVFRRYEKSMKNLLKISKSVDKIYLLDNSGTKYKLLCKITLDAKNPMKIVTKDYAPSWFLIFLNNF